MCLSFVADGVTADTAVDGLLCLIAGIQNIHRRKPKQLSQFLCNFRGCPLPADFDVADIGLSTPNLFRHISLCEPLCFPCLE
nr:MAG TPA: hypothetical protein [Caudoviricetes sp.]